MKYLKRAFATSLLLPQLCLAVPTEEDLKPIVQADTAFALDLYGRLKDTKGNLFFSPYSISTALAMTYGGARGETADQICKVLHFPGTTHPDGDDGQRMPKNTEQVYRGMAALRERFDTQKPVPKEIRAKIVSLRKDLDAANKRAEELQRKANLGSGDDHLDAFMMANGAAEETQRLAGELNALLARFDQYELRMANALWGEKSYPFQKSYLDLVHKFFGTGGVFPVNFRTDPEPARLQINAWVEKQTSNRIKDLVPPGAVSSATRLILANAIYFKGQWKVPFPADATKTEVFKLAGGTNIRVPMMHHDHLTSARYAAFTGDGTFFKSPDEIPASAPQTSLYPDNRGFTMLEMPYKGEELTMVIIVPQAANQLPALEKRLNSANLQAWIGKLQHRPVEVFVPKFKLETHYEMKPTLTAMGMPRAFTDPALPSGAQFDGMCASQNPQLQLFIGEVIHKAFVEVNEKGTEAAAATAVIMPPTTGFSMMKHFEPTFRADKPFVFLIRDNRTESILFLGRVADPTR